MSEKDIIWLKAAGVRAIRTVAQGALGALGGATMFGQFDVRVVISTALFAGMVSLLTSVAGLPEVKQKQEENKNEN